MAAMLLCWRRDPLSGRLCQAELPDGSTVRDLLPDAVPAVLWGDFYVTCNGRRVSRDEALQNGLTYSVEPRLPGGKGGFGSMLRALGAQIEKTTNREACRDLSGRRLRDVNHEKAMAEWIKKQAEREAEKEQRRLERLKRKLAEPKHYFTDPEYQRQCSDMSERLEESVIKGLQATSSTVVSPEASDCRKRKIESQSSKGKSSKKFLWTGVEGLEMSSGSDSGSDSDSESPGTSASCHSEEQRLNSDSESSSNSASCHSAEQTPHSSDSDSDGPAPCSSSTTISKQADQAPEQSVSAESSMETTGHETATDFSQTERLEVVECEKAADVHKPPQEAPNTVSQLTPHSSDIDSDGPAPCSSSSTTSKQPDQAPEPSVSAESSMETTDPETVTDVSQTERLEVVECEKPADVHKPPQEAPNTDSVPFDLLSFSCAAELEALGLDRLKTELMVLGLKCGGTLQERAARLFSVRGLSREQIEPALFAKPAKAKKK